ncbi:class I SAM-dependent methyltransferase [Kamptonema cortianum]|nr:class I SAM-dependent methyltransferase [Geitlerinema splendidum]MDK3157620.1 class I SAM-dependent methyltransferase [Kamptonema cortianum]
MSSFGKIAPHYDLLMSNVPYDMWAGYFQLLLTRFNQEPETLLDVCCGTGSVAEILTRADYQVTGFDLSSPMIAEAKRKAVAKNLKIDYHVADARTVDLGLTFEGAYSFFDSLNYIAELEGLHQALIRIGDHLPEGAPFIFDVNTAYAFEARMFDQRENRSRAKLKYNWVGDYDPATRIIQVKMDFEWESERFTETHIQRAHSDEEVRAGLRDAGFSWVTAFDSYTLDAPRAKSDRIHYVAMKGA